MDLPMLERAVTDLLRQYERERLSDFAMDTEGLRFKAECLQRKVDALEKIVAESLRLLTAEHPHDPAGMARYESDRTHAIAWLKGWKGGS